MNRKPTAPTGKTEEEADYVNSAVHTVEKTATTPDQKFGSFTRSSSPVAGCWVILIVIMALRIYFTSVISENNGMLSAENQELKNIIDKLNSTVNNLTVQLDNLNKSYADLESNNTDVIAENQELRTHIQQLETQKKNLTDMLEDMETERNELNVSRAQWSIDQYCPIVGAVRQCKSCQAGWIQDESSCYVIIDERPPNQKTWAGAQAVCKEKNSELPVINNATEKQYIHTISWYRPGINGYWIGLRVVDGKWTWVDGSNLTDISWIQPATPTEGHCAISVQNQGLKSVSCSEMNAWICEKKALSLTPP
ncbi:C-type lectin domain family 10 member A-like isoform X1 [Acanthopagrus latus]|uniref:C-type lectin domain family 10 member A-like isoform X1 n=1 Tax=Acanthopagrus latus TaxID=8177 RepID=UPI00187BE6D3|nr:C-type lectin domain family 10 member A-like isoform X1 [Acanthopagrus latus]